MRDLTAVCAAARHISLTGGWNGRTVGAKGAQREGERRTRARSRTWPAVKGCGNKSAAHCGLTDLRSNLYPFSVEPGAGPLPCGATASLERPLGPKAAKSCVRFRGLVRRMSGKP